MNDGTDIIIYGGAFDPFTLSHRDATEKLRQYARTVMVMPCYVSLFGKQMIKYDHRLAMCRLATADMDGVVVSEFERDFAQLNSNPKPGTFEILIALEKKYPGRTLYFAIGQDNADSFHKWKNADELMRRFKFIIMPRHGCETNYSLDRWYNHRPHINITDRIQPGSSTEVRTAIAAGEYTDLLSGEVAHYITEQGLYV
jgi:nicotinate-nucleotide adenylyltransferase